MLEFQGRAALSDFRIAKLIARLQVIEPRVQGLRSHYVHFVDASAALSPAQEKVLTQLLTYGPMTDEPVTDPGAATEVLLVVPRSGMISPWSSKATDIARVCGL